MSKFFCYSIFALTVFLSAMSSAEDEFVSGELIFPLESWHNHGSALVECPNGDILVCWFHGSGERRSDDVLILGARKVKATGKWTKPFVMADAPGFPDTNCTMIIDPEGTLWLLWPTIQANLWESALMKYKTSTDYMNPVGPPKWDAMKILHVKPGDDFEEKVRKQTKEYFGKERVNGRSKSWADRNYEQAADKLTRRLGWFTRAHPKFLDDGRLLVGLYSDGFSFSLVAITDDLGETWTFSDPIVGGGNIQPSFAVKDDGTIVTYMRDNGPAPKRVHVSESTDRGETWSKVYDHEVFYNPGSGLEVMNTENGEWLCIYNDMKLGRNSLAISLSEDEGKTWPWTRHIEKRNPGAGAFHYPSIIEGTDGNFHVTYSYFIDQDTEDEKRGKSIRYATFNREWLKGRD